MAFLLALPGQMVIGQYFDSQGFLGPAPFTCRFGLVAFSHWLFKVATLSREYNAHHQGMVAAEP